MNLNGRPLRFHPNHAVNVILEEDGSVAFRTAGYGNGIVFSERYLHPGEFFVVEIEQNENHWQGHLRLGLTQINPIEYPAADPLCRQGMFDLRRLGSTWMFALTELPLNLRNHQTSEWPYDINVNNIDVSENYIKTCFGDYARIHLNSTENYQKYFRFSGLEVGFKIGVVYIPNEENFADLYYVVNGDVYGPYAMEIPYKESPLFAVADVYGKTTKIRALSLQSEKTLKQLCREIILQTYDMKNVNKLPLPKSILDYLNFNPIIDNRVYEF